MSASFHEEFVELFDGSFRRLQRYLARLSGDAELAADLAQDAFVRLYQRRSLPDRPEAWLIAVATNLFRNARTKQVRRLRLLTPARGEQSLADPPIGPAEATDVDETRRQVGTVLDRMSERERRMLLLRAEGYGYRDIAVALKLNEASVGTLLARAKRNFRTLYEDIADAP
jgi:RNA polymerase sigma-70 factor (ECF subfamily)